MKKLKIKGLNKEMSTTGTGASFASGTGAQYATPKAFKKKDEIGEPFTKPNPSIPNRKSKFIDYDNKINPDILIADKTSDLIKYKFNKENFCLIFSNNKFDIFVKKKLKAKCISKN